MITIIGIILGIVIIFLIGFALMNLYDYFFNFQIRGNEYILKDAKRQLILAGVLTLLLVLSIIFIT